MAKCKWCECDAEVNKHGYCESCNNSIRADIKKHIAVLTELVEQAAPFLPDDEKTAIYKTMLEEYEILKGYKAKQVPFFKSDIEVLKANIVKNLGMEAEPLPPSDEEIFKRSKRQKKYLFLLLFGVICSIICGIFWGNSMRNDNKRAQVIEIAKKTILTQFSNPSTTSFGYVDELFTVTKESKNIYTVSSWCDADDKNGKRGFYSFSVKLGVNFESNKYEVMGISLKLENFIPNYDS